jgi:hypothetical protein
VIAREIGENSVDEVEPVRRLRERVIRDGHTKERF